MLPFTYSQLQDAVGDGRVTARRHSSLPYTILNYAPEVQWLNRWDDVTMNCRGLIVDDWFNVIARPWKKFFNLGQVNLPIQFDTPVEVMDKVDGSLGILYPGLYGTYAIATRGSFESDQAIHATGVWNERYASRIPGDVMTQSLLQRYTFLFEIVYPANRIVLDYMGQDNLILLGAVEKSTGYYVGPKVAAAMIAWPGPVVEVMPFNTISDALGHMDRKNAEGFVVRAGNFMVKMKQPDYLDLHRLITNASPKTVWEQLRDGKSKSEIVSNFPDEFHDYISSMIDPLLERFAIRYDEISLGFAYATNEVLRGSWGYENSDFPSRAAYAAVFKKSKDARYYFLILDSKPIKETLWNELKPREARIDALTT